MVWFAKYKLFYAASGQHVIFALIKCNLYAVIEQQCQSCNGYVSLSMKSSWTELNFKLHVKYLHLCKGLKTALLYKFLRRSSGNKRSYFHMT